MRLRSITQKTRIANGVFRVIDGETSGVQNKVLEKMLWTSVFGLNG